MKNKVAISLFSVILLITLLAQVCFATADIRERPDIMVIINGVSRTYTDPPIISNGRALLPLRELLGSLKVAVDGGIQWDDSAKSITINDGSNNIFLQIGSNYAKVNNTPIVIDAAPMIYKNRAYIPVRFISQSLDKMVAWDNGTENVLICDKDRFEETKSIINEMNKKMDEVKRFKRTDNVNFKFSVREIDHEINTDIKISTDYENKKEYSLLNRKSSDEETEKKLEVYSDNEKQKIKVDNGEWKDYKLDNVALKKSYSFSELEGSNILYCGLSVNKDEVTKEIVLEGMVNLYDYSHGAMAFEGIKDYQLDNALSRIVLDKDTKLIKEINMTASLPQKYDIGGESTNIAFKINLKTVYYDYNENFSVPNP